MRGLNRALFRKELALQKTNMMFTLGTVLLGSIALGLFSVVEFEFATVSSSDLKNMVMFMAVAPLLLTVIPVMMGATAAAAEKPLGVLAWQDALPVGRWRVAAMKLAVVVLGVCVVSGFLPFVMLTLHTALEERIVEFTSALEVFSVFGGWIVPVGLICAAVGFYTGAYARNDYQALLMAVIPLGLVVYVMFLADPLGRVFPVIMDEWPTKPLVMTRRLVIIAALFAWLGCGLLGRVPRRRWVVMVGHGVLVAVVVFGLTLWNIVAEYRVLSYVGGSTSVLTPPSSGDEVYSLSSTLVSMQRSSDNRSGCRQWLSYLEEVDLPGEERMAIGYLMRSCSGWSILNTRKSQPFLIFHNEEMPTADPNGLEVVEFPQAVVENEHILGVARNKRWIQTGDMLFGPWGLSVRRGMIPQGWFEKLSARVGIQPITKERGTAVRQDGEIIVDMKYEGEIAWHDGQKYLPGVTHLSPTRGSTLSGDPTSVRVMVNDGGTTTVAILKPVDLEGLPYRYELAGWSPGPYGSVSADYRWVLSLVERTAFVVAPLEVDSPLRDGVTSDSASGVWTLQARRAVDDVTSLSLAYVQDPFLKIDARDYAAFSYVKGRLDVFGDPELRGDEVYEGGVMVFDPESGREHFFPVRKLEGDWFTNQFWPDRLRPLRVQGNKGSRMMVSLPDDSMVGMVFSVTESGDLKADKTVYLRDGDRSERGFFLNANTFIYPQDDSVRVMMF